MNIEYENDYDVLVNEDGTRWINEGRVLELYKELYALATKYGVTLQEIRQGIKGKINDIKQRNPKK